MGCIILWFLVQGDTHNYLLVFCFSFLFSFFLSLYDVVYVPVERSRAFSQIFCIFSPMCEKRVQGGNKCRRGAIVCMSVRFDKWRQRNGNYRQIGV